MDTVILLFLFVSLILYVMLGGADFGAGIVELFTGKNHKKTISSAIAPIWEANHVWLILVIVILFVVYPRVYTTVTTYLHIPLLVVLLGIIFRGVAFSFRHYDTREDKVHDYYTWFFTMGSIITPIFLGIVLGAINLGKIQIHSNNFVEAYISPWFNWYSLAVGIMISSLFAYISSIYLIGEAENKKERENFIKVAKSSFIVTFISGMLVFFAAQLYEVSMIEDFLAHPTTMVTLIIATLLIPLIWVNLRKGNMFLRLTVGFQVVLIITGWIFFQFPDMVRIADGKDLTIYNTLAPASTQKQVLIALVVGFILVVPFFLYLFKVFKFSDEPKSSSDRTVKQKG